jgi:hypothetical protein
MTMLSPKAWRFVDIALKDMGERGSAVGASLDRDPTHELSARTAETVLTALNHFEQTLKARLASGGLSEDEASDASNDLGFVRAVEHDVSQGLGRRRRA